MGTDKRARQKANRQLAREARAKQEQRSKLRRRGLRYGLGLPLIILALFALSRFFVDSNDGATEVTDTTVATQTLETLPGEKEITGKTPCPKTDGTEVRVTQFEQAPQMCIDAKKSYTATFDTTEGVIEVALDTKNTPETVNNFVVLSRYKYYDTSYIFRTDPSIDIIQGGGSNNTDGPGYTIKDEGTGFKYAEGDLVMARSQGPDTGGGQWFFVAGPKASVLDGQGTYVTFGKVTKGLDVVKSILALHDGAADQSGAPSKPVKIGSIAITEK